MRLLIKTTGVRFRAGGPAEPKKDYRDKDKQATTPDGRPIWVVRLTAFDTSTEQGSSESIWVEVAGDEPELTPDELVQIDGLVFAPWISGPARKDHKIVRNFRADSGRLASATGKAVHPRRLSQSPARTEPSPARDQTRRTPMTTSTPTIPTASPGPSPDRHCRRCRSARWSSRRGQPAPDAAQLPQPRYSPVDPEQISVRFAPVDVQSIHTLGRWARHGSAASSHQQTRTAMTTAASPSTASVKFPYLGVSVNGYARIPAGDIEASNCQTRECRPGGP